MKKINLKRIFALLCSVVMLLSLMSVNIGAATTIDTNATGSIKINKVDTTGSNFISGVGFSTVKVADFAQYTQTTTSGVEQTTLMFVLTTAGETLLGSYISGGITVGTDTYYTSSELQAALEAAYGADTSADYQVFVNSVKGQTGSSSGTTSTGNGTLTFSTGVGVYIVVEDASATTNPLLNGTGNTISINTVSAPFLVAVPQTDDNGESWIYNVEGTPKNILENSSTEKKIYDTSGNEIASVSVGETYTYKVTSNIIVTADSTAYEYYRLYDIADVGIEYLNTGLNGNGSKADFVNIWLDVSGDGTQANDGTEDSFTYETDYSVTFTYNNSKLEFTILLTEAGLAKINAVTADTTIYFEYQAYLSTTAAGGLSNAATVTYRHKSGDDTDDPSPEPEVYTYGITLEKSFSGSASVDASAVTFGVTDVNGTVYATKNSDGSYTAAADITDSVISAGITSGDITDNGDGSYTTSGGDTYYNVFTVLTSGRLIINGLGSGTYTLTELTTADGYSLLKEPFDVEITDANGSVTLSVVNETQSIFELPLTGGLGSWIYTAIGLGFVAFAIYLVLKVTGTKKTA
ncbi:MAG: SpaH/EbpB family LPXTG-anchored major pilin [Clostridiales bacterium]|nr:SpaH/EbpB family LPXTG-anchored major pilin [Clostridiales bacterium]